MPDQEKDKEKETKIETGIAIKKNLYRPSLQNPLSPLLLRRLSSPPPKSRKKPHIIFLASHSSVSIPPKSPAR